MDIILSDRHQIYRPYRSICGDCRYFDEVTFTCAAFPEEIPDSVLTGDIDHYKPLLGQKNNIVFAAK